MKEGNELFISETKSHNEVRIDTRHVLGPQCDTIKPIAIVVSCSDNRAPPEVIFRQKIGNLFVIRVAGNTIDSAAMGSLEYAVNKFNVPLIVVMGHQCCGAVDAALHALKNNKIDFKGSIGAIVEPVIPAVIQANFRIESDDFCIEKSINENVRRTVKKLRDSPEPILSTRLECKILEIVGARYDFTGQVSFIDLPPGLQASPNRPTSPDA